MTLRQRFDSLPAPSPADRLVLRAGVMADYTALSPFHYLGGRPATVTRVLVLESVSRAAERGRSSPAVLRCGPGAGPSIAAVLVESMPVLSCRLRDVAVGRRWSPGEVNGRLRCISRVIVHPRWRGLGLGVRLVRHALATAPTDYTEAMAAMGNVHPLFELAGMTPHRHVRHELKRHKDRMAEKVYYLKRNEASQARDAL